MPVFQISKSRTFSFILSFQIWGKIKVICKQNSILILLFKMNLHSPKVCPHPPANFVVLHFVIPKIYQFSYFKVYRLSQSPHQIFDEPKSFLPIAHYFLFTFLISNLISFTPSFFPTASFSRGCGAKLTLSYIIIFLLISLKQPSELQKSILTFDQYKV